ncbi:MAG TPA: hypothetical protein VMP11_21495 [Verrucomicrobiae bacterium]|nr:hypothetical protein [Verrucomicrobiae bacterium]
MLRQLRRWTICSLGLGLAAFNFAAHAQVDSWTNSTSDKWETGANWSLGVPPSANLSGAFITNASSKTVTIDATTAGNYPGTMTISNLIVSAPAGATNTLFLSAAGGTTPLYVSNQASIRSGGLIDIENSSLELSTNTNIGSAGYGLTNDGTLLLGSGGTITLSPVSSSLLLYPWESELIVGNSGTGWMMVSTGTIVGAGEAIVIGNNSGSQGTLTVADGAFVGGLCTLSIAQSTGANGAVWMTGGQLMATNSAPVVGNDGAFFGISYIGYSGKGQMTVSNGVAQMGQLWVGFSSGSQGTLTVAGGSLTCQALNLGPSGPAAAWVTGGQLSITNTAGSLYSNASAIRLGCGGTGTMTISNGAVSAGVVSVGAYYNGYGQGTLTIAGGNLTAFSNLNAGSNGVGSVWVTGGQLTVTNGPTSLLSVGGDASGGRMTVSNGAVSASSASVGDFGTLTVAGGSVSIYSNLTSADSGLVLLTGGQIVATNASVVIGAGSETSHLTVTGGTLQAASMIVGPRGLFSAPGSVLLSGGTVSVYSNVAIGDCRHSMGNTVTITSGGSLFVTNVTHTAFLDIRSGTLTVNSGGILEIDTLVMTNTCGLLVPNGGTLIVSNLVLDPNLSAVGDGIPNGWKQQYGLDPLDPNLANEDLTGTGFTVLQDYLAGVDPTNPAAAFAISSITPTGNNLLVTWTMGPNRTNALQATPGDAFGNFATNGFTDIFTVTNTVGATTNFTDTGAATNQPSRFYRVRIVP